MTDANGDLVTPQTSEITNVGGEISATTVGDPYFSDYTSKACTCPRQLGEWYVRKVSVLCEY